VKPTRCALVALGIAALIAFGAACSSESPDESADSSNAAMPTTGAGEPFGEEPAAQADGAAVVGDDGSANQALPDVLDRKIIQNTTVDLEVEEVSRTFQDIMNIALTAGGHVASSSFSNDDDQQIADLTIRVPAEQHQQVLQQLREMGEVTQESSDANDITEEYTDLQARLRTLEATEGRYLELLGRAQAIPDILTVQDRLDGVRGQIEQVQGRINMFDQLTDLGTITVHLRPLAAAAGADVSPVRAAEAAWEASLAAVEVVATVAVAVVVFSWWLLIPGAIVVVAARWWLSRRPRATAGTTT
jgi:hypothetical protein